MKIHTSGGLYGVFGKEKVMTEKHTQMLRALHCLRLEAPDAVVTSVSDIVLARIAELESENAELKVALAEAKS